MSEMQSILPPNRTPGEAALEQAIGHGRPDLTDIAKLIDPQTCPEEHLGWLAWAFSVDVWDSEWSTDFKRNMIALSIAVHRVKGTRGSVKRALDALGFRIDIVEGWEEGGAAHTFRLDAYGSEIFAAGQQIDSHLVETVTRLIENVKPVRSHFSLRFGESHGGDVNVAVGSRDRMYETAQVHPQALVPAQSFDMVLATYSRDVAIESQPVEFLTPALVNLMLVIGQSTAGPGSGEKPPLLSVMPNGGYLVEATASKQAYGETLYSAPADPRFRPCVDWIGSGQNPASMIALAAVEFAKAAGEAEETIAVATSWEGSQPASSFQPNAAGHFNHENAVALVAANLKASRSEGREMATEVFYLQGHGGPHDRAEFTELFTDWLDVAVPQYGATPHCYSVQNNTSSGSTNGEEPQLAHLDVARARLGLGLTLAGPSYSFPLHDGTHQSTLGRMGLGEMIAYARRIKRSGRTFRPLWPAHGKVLISERRLVLPLEMPIGSAALAFDRDRVAFVPQEGFVLSDSEGEIGLSDIHVSGSSLVMTMDRKSNAAAPLLRYAPPNLDYIAPYFAAARGTVFARSAIASPFAAMGYDLPATIRFYLTNFEESCANG